MKNPLVRELYSEDTLNDAVERLQGLEQTPDSIVEILEQVGINRRTLVRTVRKGKEEYLDRLLELKQNWNPKMLGGTPKEKKEVYRGFYSIVKDMEEFSEPYISAMRLVTDAALKAMTESYMAKERSRFQTLLRRSLEYQGKRLELDAESVGTISVEEEFPTTVKSGLPESLINAYIQIAKKQQAFERPLECNGRRHHPRNL